MLNEPEGVTMYDNNLHHTTNASYTILLFSWTDVYIYIYIYIYTVKVKEHSQTTS